MNKNQIRLKTPINLALIKYWGKFEINYNLPLNSSYSITISRDQIYTEVTAKFSDDQQDKFQLLDQSGTVIENSLPKKFQQIKYFFQQYLKSQNSNVLLFVDIVSQNNFPTQAGMASSASGFCSLVLCMSRLVNYFEETDEEYQQDIMLNITQWFEQKNIKKMQKVFLLTILLRQCSLSSMRSIFLTPTINIGPDILINKIQIPQVKFQQEISDNFLKKYLHFFMDKKVNEDHLIQTKDKYFKDKDISIDELVYRTQAYTFLKHKEFFQNISVLILIIEKEKKKVASTNGMIQSTLTSELLPQRVQQVSKRIKNILEYIEQKNYTKFFELIMKDSNQFHSICQESYPPLFYLNDISKKIINKVHEFNKENNIVCGYSFDAGPNAFILVHKDKLQALKINLKEFKDYMIETSISSNQFQ